MTQLVSKENKLWTAEDVARQTNSNRPNVVVKDGNTYVIKERPEVVVSTPAAKYIGQVRPTEEVLTQNRNAANAVNALFISPYHFTETQINDPKNNGIITDAARNSAMIMPDAFFTGLALGAPGVTVTSLKEAPKQIVTWAKNPVVYGPAAATTLTSGVDEDGLTSGDLLGIGASTVAGALGAKAAVTAGKKAINVGKKVLPKNVPNPKEIAKKIINYPIKHPITTGGGIGGGTIGYIMLRPEDKKVSYVEESPDYYKKPRTHDKDGNKYL